MSAPACDNRWQSELTHVCEYCLMHEDDTLWGCEVDHIVSRKHGGRTEPGNLAWACALCNSRKGSDIATILDHSATRVRLFHPCQDKWLTHFHLNHVLIEANGDIGRATVQFMELNEVHRLEERTAAAEVGRYPTIEALARMKE